MKRLAYIFTLIATLLVGAATCAYAQPRIKGNVYGGGENAKVVGDIYTYEEYKDLPGNSEVSKEAFNNLPVEQKLKSLTGTQTTVTFNNGEVYGNIYGGGALANVYGNTNVVIDEVNETKKGKFAGDVFGGGKGDDTGAEPQYANVLGNTNVKVTGGEIIWDKKLNNNKEIVEWEESTKSQFFSDKKYTVDHNIYAGGHIASVVGTWSDANTCNANTGISTLTMTHGLLSGELLNSDHWKQAFTEHEHPHFYAFGGGYGIYTKAHESDVQILLPMFDVEGANGGDEQLARPRKAARNGGNEELLPIITDAYGVAWTTVLGVLGGGYNGHVEKTNVLIGDATYAHRVYGGGLGSYEGWVQANVNETPNTDADGYVGTTGTLPLTNAPADDLQTTHVVIAGGHIHGDVFGGGAGVESRKVNDVLTDFPEIARVKGNTLVETYAYRGYKYMLFYDSLANYIANKDYYGTIDLEKHFLIPNAYIKNAGATHAQIFGNVYGGGDVANVSGNTKVGYHGGKVFGNTFGAGLGRLASEAKDYTVIGRVTGNSEVELNDTILVPYVTIENMPKQNLKDSEDVQDVAGRVYEHDNFDDKDDDLQESNKHCYFVVQDATQNIGINFKPHAWGDIYGGGRNGLTGGDASVVIDGGLVGNNIFGGGLGDVRKVNGSESITSADVLGNTTVTVRGGQYIWRQIADVNGNIKTFPETVNVSDDYKVSDNNTLFKRNIINNKMMLTPLIEPIKDFFDYNKASYTRDHSIYGGGNIACKVGTYLKDNGKYWDPEELPDMLRKAKEGTGKATVDMQCSLFTDNDIRWTDDEDWNLATLCRYLACENSSNYQFGVFGGGYGANTKVGKTEVKLEMGYLELLKEAKAAAEGVTYSSVWNQYMDGILDWAYNLTQDEKDALYGGTTGVNATNRAFTARMAHSINVPSHTTLTAAGGGFAGYVAGDTKVSLERRSGALRIFGGGIGLQPTDTELTSLDQTAADGKTYGQVGGNTTVNVEYGVVVKDVFGGGAGIASLEKGSSYVDFPNMARVLGKTEVHVHATNNQPTQTLVYGRVFGGGDVANVGQDGDAVKTNMQSTDVKDVANEEKLRTKVTVDAGCVFSDVFAGGSGRVSENCNNYANLGAVYGNTQLVINQPETGGENSTWLWKDVYGGGRNGIVKGNTLVEIKGGWLGNNVFGGGLGNIGSRYNLKTGMDEEVITAANVTQNTNILVTGGQYCISQTWDDVQRSWKPVNKDDNGNPYSSQYDPYIQKFLLSHNIYGGGNVACNVGHDTWVDMTKGLLPKQNGLGHEYKKTYGDDEEKNQDFFGNSDEWKEIHDKHASPYFSVFGGGYGVNTLVANNSNVTIAMEGVVKPNENTDPTPENLYKIFYDRQSVLDVIGGGYDGAVTNTCNIDIKGNSFIRNVFGGAYYATVGNTVINATRGNIENIYGGGMMGNVDKNVTVNFGKSYNVDINDYNIGDAIPDSDTDVEKAAKLAKNDNSQLFIMQDIYGGNDVSGYVGAHEEIDGSVTPTPESSGVAMVLNGGTIFGNVYGGGNGNYLYMIDQDADKVTAEEDYQIDQDDPENTALVYHVPLREAYFPSVPAMTAEQKMVNLASYRPGTQNVSISFKGNSASDILDIKGNLFCGGNSATISNYTDGNHASAKLDIGSHARIDGLFLGSDGDALFDKGDFLTYYPKINNIKTLYEAIDWTQPENREIPSVFLPTSDEERPHVYKNVLDLYFLPVEMPVMPEVTWNGLNSSTSTADRGAMNPAFTYDDPGVEDLDIGTFCCGGNRGNMDTPTKFHIYFPEGLTITNKIVGGCNNASRTYEIPGVKDDDGNQATIEHVGGFLLGTHNVGADHSPQINLTLRNKFRIEKEKDANGVEQKMYPEACNVFGGCYDHGNVRGDVRIEVMSNMLLAARDDSGNEVGLDSVALRRATDAGRTVCGIYGGGYGQNTFVYGDTEVRLGNAAELSRTIELDDDGQPFTDGKYHVEGASCNYIFGGGREGSIVGNTTVRVLNGRVGGCVVGASYSGYLYGNSQVIIGYPKYYMCKETGEYALARVDQDPNHLRLIGEDGSPVIKQSVWYTKGDLVSEASYWEMKDAEKSKFDDAYYTNPFIPDEDGWKKVNIQIDKAVYGGGYALAGGSGVGAGAYTVRKYTKKYNLNEYAQTIYGLTEGKTLDDDNGSAEAGNAFGGNTLVMIADKNQDDTKNQDENGNELPAGRDHITISSSQLRQIYPNPGDNMFGKYHEVLNKNNTPDDSHDDFYTIEYIPNDILFDTSRTEKFYQFTGEGGIYGDGHLSVSEGFRLSDIASYGYNGSYPAKAKLMNCLHRFDIVRLTDCCFSLLGDLDYASNLNATPYSIANVGELQMFSTIDKQNKLMEPLMNKRSRNYMGLSNRVMNIGAVYSDVDFANAEFHHGNEGKYSSGGGDKNHEDYGFQNAKGVTYKAFKQQMIETYYDCTKKKLKDVDKAAIYFQLRNDGTAKNLIGIGSGYALMVENTFDKDNTTAGLSNDERDALLSKTHDTDVTFRGAYYGPVKGVFEVNLISVREGEAGGYVYAQNIHENTSYGDPAHTTHFLESSGNFVFPVTAQRKVIDDCFPSNYVRTTDEAEGHYWYITGLKYYYNATITGYTFDEDMEFDMPNNSVITLTGAKAGQSVRLEDFHFLNHTDAASENCDFRRKVDGKRLLYTDSNHPTDCPSDRYMLSLSTSKSGLYSVTAEDGNTPVPYIQTLPERTAVDLPNILDVNDANIAVRLTDKVKNNGKVTVDGVEQSYYNYHLADPCEALLVLTVPALDDNGFIVYSDNAFEAANEDTPSLNNDDNHDGVAKYYILNFDGTFIGLNELGDYQNHPDLLYKLKREVERPLTDLEKSNGYNPGTTYYTLNDDGLTYTAKTGWNGSDWDDNKEYLYVKEAPQPSSYQYTINLTIKYIKGPSHSGHINIKNCALPGEMIRLSHENVKIESDVESLPHNGNFWTIGPGKKVPNDAEHPENGWHWELAETGNGVISANDFYHHNPESKNYYYPYNPYVTDSHDKMKGKALSTLMSEGVGHGTGSTDVDYYLPAYYFMNGYVVQYSYTVKGIDKVFTTTINPSDTLTIHNYHRMQAANDMLAVSGQKNISQDLLVPWAAEASQIPAFTPATEAEAKDWKATHHRPRVYIQNENDLKAFAQYLKRTATNKPEISVLEGQYNKDNTPVTYTEVAKPASDAGANTDFFLMANITVPDDWEAIENFCGTLHGNGHVISGLGTKALFKNIAVGAEVYNLGLESGSIAESNSGTANYHCCYVFNDGSNATPRHIYNKDGVLTGNYTADDWRYGRVAYDLNEFYLAERLDRHNTDVTGDNAVHDLHAHDGYVEKFYADGDYRYARYEISNTNNTTEYLRSQAAPNYAWGYDQNIVEAVSRGEKVSYHYFDYDMQSNELSHSVDEARAYYENDEFKEYRPLIDEAMVNTAVNPAPTAKKNDYIFFGQTLNASTLTADANAVGTALPTVVSASANATQPGNASGVTHAVDNQTNRIWRAYGFYKSKKDDAFHFNRAAWALQKELTAIDFTGLHDANYRWQSGKLASAASSNENPAGNADIFYPMVMDMPDALTSFNVASNKTYTEDGKPRSGTAYDNSWYGRVTQNLLVYNNGETVFNNKDTEGIAESAVQYHNIVKSGDQTTYSTDYFHLVDKQDFNAPIAFNVGTRAWYERTPSVFRNVSGTGESYATPSAWEGIILPFTAKKVTASENKEISHFYGEVPAEGENMQTLHHEYWLKGMVAADGDKATFARPSKAGSGLFTDNTLHRQEYATNETPYTYPANTYFTGLTNYTDYHDSDYNDGDTAGDEWARSDQEWYLSNHDFADYVYLSKTVPYLIAFPGNNFYEFSMEGINYDTDTHTKSGNPQLVTFEHNGTVTIAVSDNETGDHTTTIGSHNHVGTYKHETGKLGVNNDGSAFTIEAGDVLPFRTYLTETTPSHARTRRVLIYDSNVDGMEGILQEEEREPENPGEELSGKSLKMYVMGTELIIESNFVTDLRTYTAAGQYIRQLHVNEGVNRYNDLGRGIYIIGNKKVIIR